ncbi:histidine phosphatase family protein [Zafaria sp. Z1313]|uniref:histidine phosphatase family protein n=1 Tax=unclassified Zafaria TaxID=2828765 RepID=UPI002E7A540D|nr:histidine phosphatase family protein [Zafaria sp. J156]MEE1622554.1 histidine phosphatase family protein [Zafaria sp. J156]
MRLILVRHGQTSSNIGGFLDTARPGPGLTGLGERQAEAITSVLDRERIGVLYASTLLRAQQTAAPLAARLGLDINIRDGLREVLAGDLEMRGDEASRQTYLETIFSWSEGAEHHRIPGGEDGLEALGRLDRIVEEAATTGAGTVALFTHGALIRGWAAARASNIDAAFAARHPVPNGGVVVLEGAPAEGWDAVAWPEGIPQAASGAQDPASGVVPVPGAG